MQQLSPISNISVEQQTETKNRVRLFPNQTGLLIFLVLLINLLRFLLKANCNLNIYFSGTELQLCCSKYETYFERMMFKYFLSPKLITYISIDDQVIMDKDLNTNRQNNNTNDYSNLLQRRELLPEKTTDIILSVQPILRLVS